MTQEKVVKQLEAVIQALSEKTGPKGSYWAIEIPPIPPSKFPAHFQVFNASLLEGLQVGDTVLLTLERGREKKPNPQYFSDYYWDVIDIDGADLIKAIEKAAAKNKPPEKPTPPPASKVAGEQSLFLPILRQVAFKGAIELVAALVIADKLGDSKPSEAVEKLTDHFQAFLLTEDWEK